MKGYYGRVLGLVYDNFSFIKLDMKKVKYMSTETIEGTDLMNAAVDHYLEHSRIKSNGVREIGKAAFVTAMKKHGVTEEEMKRVQTAVEYETTAAARVALADTEKKLPEMSDEDRANDELRKAVTSTVRLPTFGGYTEVECRGEKHSNIPFRTEGADGPATKIDYGRFRTTINARTRIHPDLHDEACNRIKAALGIKD